MIKWTVLIFLGLAGVNLLTWALWGRESSLLLGADAGPVLGWVEMPDTLVVFGRHIDLLPGYVQAADYDGRTVSRFAERLEQSTRLVVLTDPRPLPLVGEGEGAERLESRSMAYDVSVRRAIPLYAEVSRMLWAPGFAVVVTSHNVWFFRWWKIADGMTAIS
jgi:hypothetical protein